MLSADAHRLTDGHIARTLFKFALPYLGANFLVALYGAADVLIVSYFASPAALAATSTGAQAVFTMMALAIGLTLGGTILIGQYFGAKKEKDVIETIQTVFSLFAITALIGSAVMFIFARPIAALLETPPEAFQGACQYIMICGGGLIFTFAYESISAVLRGLGDSKNPLKFIAAACSMNILLDLLFVGGFNWGAAGAAAATVISQAFSVLVAVLYLRHRKFIFDFSWKSFGFHSEKAKKILRLGIPSAIQQTVIFTSFTIMTAIVNKMGVIASAAAGITTKIDGFMIMPSLAFASAVSVMTAQNIGARQIKRAKETFYTGFLMALCFGAPSFYMMYHHAPTVMRLVTENTDIINAGADFMLAYSPDCILLSLVFCLNGFLNGSGRTTFTMTNNLISTLFFRVPLIFQATTLFAAGFALPLSTIPQIMLSLFYFYKGYWKKSVIDNPRRKNDQNS